MLIVIALFMVACRSAADTSKLLRAKTDVDVIGRQLAGHDSIIGTKKRTSSPKQEEQEGQSEV